MTTFRRRELAYRLRQFTREFMDREAALAIEARRATTTEIGVVHESATPKGNAQ